MTGEKIRAYSASRLGREFRPLAELLPLRAPLSLLVDPTNICNFRCVFCPTGDAELLARVGRPKGVMPAARFRKIVDDLSDFPRPLKVLHLYKDGEPLANRSLAEMVAYAKGSGSVERVETTTNGLLLTPARASELIDAGLDGIRISVYALDDGGYRKVTGNAAKFEKIRSNVEFLYKTKQERGARLDVHCKIVDTNLSRDDRARFETIFSPIADSVHIDSIMGWSASENRDFTLGLQPRAGISGAPRLEGATRKVCAEPFMKLAIAFNGDVSVCCVDWAHETTVGNVDRDSLLDVWEGPRLRAFRLLHLKGMRETHPACRHCDYVRGLPAYADLDDEATRLLTVYATPAASD